MRGISEESLKVLLDSFGNHTEIIDIYNDLLNECRELDPWMTLEEFLKSGFVGKCWVCTREKEIIECNFNGVVFSHGRRSIISVIFTTHVMPIHKPEPPRC